MTFATANPPIVLSFSVLDPSGAGGLQASIETAASLGCHCAPVITAACTSGAGPDADIAPSAPGIIIEQARSILEYMDVSAICTGYIGSRQSAEAIHSILNDFSHIPVVSHPGLCFLSSDDERERRELIDAYSNLILPLSTLANLSLFEARIISNETDTLETTAHSIISSGCETAIITGTGQHNHAFQNSVFNAKGLVNHTRWEQEPADCYSASGTLSTALACYLAHGFIQTQAIDQAQNFTWQAMRASRELGFGRRTPHRFFWADKNIEVVQNTPPSPRSH